MNVAIKTAIGLLGTQQKLADACGVTQQAVYKWLKNKSRVSPEIVPLIVKSTNGIVRACEIRPDLPGLFGECHASEPKHSDA